MRLNQVCLMGQRQAPKALESYQPIGSSSELEEQGAPIFVHVLHASRQVLLLRRINLERARLAFVQRNLYTLTLHDISVGGGRENSLHPYSQQRPMIMRTNLS